MTVRVVWHLGGPVAGVFIALWVLLASDWPARRVRCAWLRRAGGRGGPLGLDWEDWLYIAVSSVATVALTALTVALVVVMLS